MSKKAKTILLIAALVPVMLGFIYGVALLINLLVVLVAGGKITQQIEKFIFPISIVAGLMINMWLYRKILKVVDRKVGGLEKYFSSLGFGKKNNRE